MTSCCFRGGRCANRSTVAARPATRAARAPPRTRICAPNRRRRSRFARPITPDTAPAPAIHNVYDRYAPALPRPLLPTARRWTARSTRCAAPSRGWFHQHRALCAPPTTATCSAPTAACIKSGSTCMTRATRVPFVIARIGDDPPQREPSRRHLSRRPRTNPARCGGNRRRPGGRHTGRGLHRSPSAAGQESVPIIDGAEPDPNRAVYILTRDNMLEGDSGASGLARMLRLTTAKHLPCCAFGYQRTTASISRGLVIRVSEHPRGAGHIWKLVRTFDDPATWTEPGVRHLAANSLGGDAYRTDPLDDQWGSTT